MYSSKKGGQQFNYELNAFGKSRLISYALLGLPSHLCESHNRFINGY